jgi:hypothetical protein
MRPFLPSVTRTGPLAFLIMCLRAYARWVTSACETAR